MKKIKLLIATMILAAATLLTACANMDMHVKINKDLTGTVHAKFGMSDEFYKMFNIKPEDLIDRLSEIETFNNSTLGVLTYSANGYSGIVIDARVRDLSEPIDSVSIVSKKDGTIRFELPVQFFSKAVKEIDGKLGALMDGVKITLSVELPEEVTNNNANVISEDRKTLTWNVLDIGSDTMYAECEVEGISDVVWIIIAAAVVLAAAAAIIIIARKSRKDEEQQLEEEQENEPIELPEEEPEDRTETEEKETTEG